MASSVASVILHVEDNDDDAELTERAFAEANIKTPVLRARDGVEALDYLFCRGQHAGRSNLDLPAVVLLDLGLPRLNGIEVLTAIRAEPRTRHLPVVVLTSSNEERDRLDAYGQNVNSYVQKPGAYHDFVTAARQLGQYWMELNQPPPATA